VVIGTTIDNDQAQGALIGNNTIASVFDIISKPARRSEVVMLKVRL
jgi:hypothetical protein